MKYACLVFAACTVLAACSGKEQALEFPLQADQVRILTGGEVPAVSDEDIVPILENVLGAANLVNIGNPVINFSEPLPADVGAPQLIPIDCIEDLCTRYRNVGLEPVSDDLSIITFDSGENRGVASHRGVTLVQGFATVPHPSIAKVSVEYREYGGWLDHSAFFGQYVRELDENGMEIHNVALGYSFGYAAGRNPVVLDATWRGVMVGVDTLRDGTRGLYIQGDATIDVDGSVAAMTAGIAFTNIYDLTTRDHHVDMIWNGVPVLEGNFQAGEQGNSVQGTFYGPNQEEAGGVFERDSYAGSFGTRRQ